MWTQQILHFTHHRMELTHTVGRHRHKNSNLTLNLNPNYIIPIKEKSMNVTWWTVNGKQMSNDPIDKRQANNNWTKK